MLHEFLEVHRTMLIDRCRLKVAQRPVPAATNAEVEHGIPLFFEQLIEALRIEQTSEPIKTPCFPAHREARLRHCPTSV